MEFSCPTTRRRDLREHAKLGAEQAATANGWAEAMRLYEQAIAADESRSDNPDFLVDLGRCY